MPAILPFKALRYAGPTGDLSSLIAPPYDVLDEGPKRAMLQRDPHNIVAIDLPVTPPKTLGPDEAYNAAGDLFRQWIAQGVLKSDDQPAIYAYEQVYTVDGRRFARRGFFTLLGVEEFGRAGGGIHRHELTIKGGTDDRLKLMQATRAQLSPVFGIFSDPAAFVVKLLAPHFESRKPDFFGTTAADSTLHNCWRITDSAALAQLTEFFKTTDVFIADGHHRYTTALNYSKANPANAAAAGCLFFLVALQDPGMIVLPTHRIICGMKNFTMAKCRELAAADRRFTLTPTSHSAGDLAGLHASLSAAGPHAMGLFDPADDQTYTLSFASADPLAKLQPDKPECWRQLDVAILQHHLIDDFLAPHFGGGPLSCKYPQLPAVLELARQEPGRLAILVQATKLQSVCDVSLAGQVMPPKSTFFFPKLATGLVINPLQ